MESPEIAITSQPCITLSIVHMSPNFQPVSHGRSILVILEISVNHSRKCFPYWGVGVTETDSKTIFHCF